MSIIHEALKKAQNNLKDNPVKKIVPATPSPTKIPLPEKTSYSAPTPVKQGPPVIRQKSIKSENPFIEQPQITDNQPISKLVPLGKIILALAALGLLMFLQPFITKHFSSTTSTPATSAPAVVAPPPVVENTLATQTQPTYTDPIEIPAAPIKPLLILNGISTAGVNPMALINNEIYGIGDDVNGLIVVNIAEDGVELIDGDQRIFLKKRR